MCCLAVQRMNGIHFFSPGNPNIFITDAMKLVTNLDFKLSFKFLPSSQTKDAFSFARPWVRLHIFVFWFIQYAQCSCMNCIECESIHHSRFLLVEMRFSVNEFLDSIHCTIECATFSKLQLTVTDQHTSSPLVYSFVDVCSRHFCQHTCQVDKKEYFEKHVVNVVSFIADLLVFQMVRATSKKF